MTNDRDRNGRLYQYEVVSIGDRRPYYSTPVTHVELPDADIEGIYFNPPAPLSVGKKINLEYDYCRGT